MQYGYFDDEEHEYVITRPDTPKSWSNYLGSTEYGAIITNNAGGYSFYKSAAQGRFTRLRFNAVPTDQPGRYLYIRDRESGDFWSASWQPVGKPAGKYRSECRHGAGYTRIASAYASIESDVLYFVPLGRSYECWLVTLRNAGRKKRNLRLFTYVEYANNWNIAQDLSNLQYSQFIVRMGMVDGMIDHGTNVLMPELPDHFEDDGQGRHTFLAIAGARVRGFDTDRGAFLGAYGTYARPDVVARGKCRNSLAAGDNACGVLEVDVALRPGETRELVVLMGIGKPETEGKAALRDSGAPDQVRAQFRDLRDHWHGRIGHMSVRTPDREFDSMFNTWNPYNCLVTYAWSRAASLVYSGERDGLGYRDTVQDLLGVMHLIPGEVRGRLELMLTGQVSTGGAMPVVKPFAHVPGKEKPPAEHEYRSDDCLWLFNAVPAFVRETGDVDFYRAVLPYADAGEDPVWGHLKRALRFTLDRLGAHGLPCGLLADWNDCLELGQKGESMFVAFQLRYGLREYADICRLLRLPAETAWAEGQLASIDDAIRRHGWDGEWFLRAYRADGLKFGSRENAEASIFLEPQPWAVLSGHVTGARAGALMDTVEKRLGTPYGLMICSPPVENTDPRVIKARLFNQGMKENASVFMHTQPWAVIAEAMLGRGDRAYASYRRFMPSACNRKADEREIEPYVYCQFTHSPHSPRRGASRLPWLSGSAAWAYFAASQYILGIRPEYEGLRIDPCIPSAWRDLRITRTFRGKSLSIRIRNDEGCQRGVKEITVNGVSAGGELIPESLLRNTNDVVVVMGS